MDLIKETLKIIMEHPGIELDFFQDFDDSVPDIEEIIKGAEG